MAGRVGRWLVVSGTGVFSEFLPYRHWRFAHRVPIYAGVLLHYIRCMRYGLLQPMILASASLSVLTVQKTTERIEVLLGVKATGAQGTLY